jgi:RecB family exonuclease
MGAKYSASRVGTFESCTLQYDLKYNRGYYAEDTQQNVLTRKGNAFHEFAELYRPEWDEAKITEVREELEARFSLPAEFSLVQPLERYIRWYNEVLKPEMNKGAQLKREIQFDFELDGNNFTGKLDILLLIPEGNVAWIIDHKTGKSTTTTYYKTQLLLYAWALHKQYNIPADEMLSRIRASVFFPFADPDEVDVKKVFKGIRFTHAHLQEVRDHFKNLIAKIESDWEPEANITRMCDFCPFAGRKEYCALTAQSGVLPTRGIIIKQREWAIKAGKK